MKNKYYFILSIISGLLFSVVWNKLIPPISLFVAFIPLLLIIENKSLAIIKVFNFSFISFFIYHLGVVWWLYKSSLIGFVLIISTNSILMAIAFTLIYKIRKILGLAASGFAFICIWLTFEYLHYSWELSWPFMNLGNWLGETHKWIQWYEYTGVLGGTLWILFVNLFIYLLIKQIVDRKILNSIFYLLAIVAIFVLPILTSKYLYQSVNETGRALNIKIIQPNIDPYSEKYDSKLFERQINQQIKLAKSPDSNKIDCYLFPESSFPVYLNENEDSISEVIKMLQHELIGNSNSVILGGVYSFSVLYRDSLFYNTAFFLTNDRHIKVRHKSKLVIGVEKMPFQQYFSFLEKWNFNMGGYTNSLSEDRYPKVFFANDKSFGIAPVICYESVYGSYVSEFVNMGATYIAVITNDGWWGDTPGYYQHLMHSKLRAIENRKYVVRSANTGISCIINSKGDIVSSIPPFIESALEAKVIQSQEDTFYARHPDFIGKIALTFTILILLMILYTTIIKKYRFHLF